MSFSLMLVFLDAALEPTAATRLFLVVLGTMCRQKRRRSTRTHSSNYQNSSKNLRVGQDNYPLWHVQSTQCTLMKIGENRNNHKVLYVWKDTLGAMWKECSARSKWWKESRSDTRSLITVPDQLCKVTNFAGWKRCFRKLLGGLVINPVLVNCWLILTQCENSC